MIDQLIANLKKENKLVNHSFYFAHFNLMVESGPTGKNQFCLPCELAVLKYSLAQGICEVYHEFVDPGQIPLGYHFEAKDTSQRTHRIPLNHKMNNSNYRKIVDTIKSMLHLENDKVSPLYALETDMPRIQKMSAWLQEKCNDEAPPFPMLSLEKLLYELLRHADLSDNRLVFPTRKFVENLLTREMDFDYSPGMACQWHDAEDNSIHCSLTRVRRYAYAISDVCCGHYGLRLLPGHHFPVAVLDETDYEMLPPKPCQEAAYSTAPTVVQAEQENLRKPKSRGKCVEGRVVVAIPDTNTTPSEGPTAAPERSLGVLARLPPVPVTNATPSQRPTVAPEGSLEVLAHPPPVPVTNATPIQGPTVVPEGILGVLDHLPPAPVTNVPPRQQQTFTQKGGRGRGILAYLPTIPVTDIPPIQRPAVTPKGGRGRGILAYLQ